MNERIRQLAQQSGFDISNINTFNGHILPKSLESFAFNIIKECVEVAHKYDEPKLSGPGLMIGSMIEQHFGVE